MGGDEYVQQIYDQNPNLKRPRIRNGSVKFRPQQIAQVTIAAAADEIPAQQQASNDNDVEMISVAPVDTESSDDDDVERIVETMIKDSDVVKSVVDMGFELDVIRKTLTETLTEDRTFKFESRFQLVDAVLKFESSFVFHFYPFKSSTVQCKCNRFLWFASSYHWYYLFSFVIFIVQCTHLEINHELVLNFSHWILKLNAEILHITIILNIAAKSAG